LSHQQLKDNELNSNTDHFLPVGRQPCIWMEAGFLSYRLCDQDLQCESCALDKAIRQPIESRRVIRSSAVTTQASEIDLLHSLRQMSFNPEALHGRSFWYIETGPDSTLKLGLNETAVKLLPDVLEVMVPCRDAHLQAHQPVFFFKTRHGMLTLNSPLAGVVTDVNTRLLDDLKQHKISIAGPVRLLTLQHFNNETLKKNWLSGSHAIDFLKSQQETVLNHFSHDLFSHSTLLGPTSNDGGIQVENLEMAIGPARYFQIIQELFKEK
jgi:glycine cleavage system H lipoate-binding protein